MGTSGSNLRNVRVQLFPWRQVQTVEQQRELRAEIERRVQEGDAELDAIGAESLESSFRDLSKKALVDSLLDIQVHPNRQQSSEKLARKWYDSAQDVLKRRQRVLKNPELSAERLCKVFDSERIPLPPGWEDKYSVTSWAAGYKNRRARAAIQRIISTDKKQA